MHELSYHKNAIFLTLTYAPENLPANESIRKDTFQRFAKRLRKGLKNRSIKYYAIGEYGEKRGRPHYHAIIFNMSQLDKTIIENAWSDGQIHIGTVTIQSARYVTDYIHKDDRSETYGGRTPPFSLMSKRLGQQFVLDNEAQARQQLKFTMNGQDVGFPKYYKKILDMDPELFVQQAKDRRTEVLNHHKKRIGITDDIVIDPDVALYGNRTFLRQKNLIRNYALSVSLANSRVQSAKNIKAKQHLKEKGTL